MNQIPSNTPSCHFCGSHELDTSSRASLCYGIAYSVLICRNCGIGMTWPQPDEATLKRLYAPGEYRAEEGKRFIAPVEWLFEIHKRRSFARLVGGLNTGSVLDVGCGSGYTASLFAENGWSVTGVEFSDETASHARETYHINVVTTLAELQGPFDLILINHVLEHDFDPERMLRECRRLLSLDGRLVVAVPNFSSFQSRIGQSCWFHRDLPVHLFHFTEVGLAQLLEKSGYAITTRSHADGAQNFYGWLQTVLNRSGFQHNALYDFVRMRNESETGLSTAVLLSLILCVVAVPAALLGMVVEWLCHTGGVICFTAVHGERKADTRG